jgi:hypothetical protein
MHFYVFIFLFAFIYQNIFAADGPKICFSNAAEFEKAKTSLPAAIQKMPLYYTADIFFSQGMVAIKVEFDTINNKYVLSASTRERSAFDVYEKYIGKICVENQKITIVPEGGEPLNTEVKSSTELIIKDNENSAKDKIVVQLTDKNGYSKKMKKINDAKLENSSVDKKNPAGAIQ